MFGLGCITYEIVTGHKLFSSDWTVLKYVQDGLPLYPTRWPPSGPGSRLLQLGELTSTLVTVNHIARPGAKATGRQLRFIRRGEPDIEESDGTDDEDSNVESDLTIDTTSNPVLQPSLRLSAAPKKPSLSNLALGNSGTRKRTFEELRKKGLEYIRRSIQYTLLEGKEPGENVFRTLSTYLIS
jgi:hypothetical protein